MPWLGDGGGGGQNGPFSCPLLHLLPPLCMRLLTHYVALSLPVKLVAFSWSEKGAHDILISVRSRSMTIIIIIIAINIMISCKERCKNIGDSIYWKKNLKENFTSNYWIEKFGQKILKKRFWKKFQKKSEKKLAEFLWPDVLIKNLYPHTFF